MRQKHPHAAILVLFGESHMAPQHLPRAVCELLGNERLLTVLQNVDALYWQATKEQCSALREGAVKIGEDVVCVFNSSPLEKYESYRLCLERWKAAGDEQQDFTPAIYNLIFSLVRALGFQLDSPSNGTQPKCLSDSLPEVIHLVSDIESTAQKLGERSCVYLPDSNSFLIREFQVAVAAEECARFLHFACRGMTYSCSSATSIENALARFGSRLLSPESEFQSRTTNSGDVLYEHYVANKVSQSAIRRMFLTHLETREQAATALERLAEHTKA
jgi:hypothetical protein